MIFEVKITDEIINNCREEAEKIGVKYNSIRKGEGNLIGVIGEELVCIYLHAVRQNTFDYDVMIDNHKIDVKTKYCTSVPELDYNVSVADYNTTQKCDSYYFVRIHESLHWGWLLGGISKVDFYKKATFAKQGEIDQSSKYNWKFTADCYNLKIEMLQNKKLESLFL